MSCQLGCCIFCNHIDIPCADQFNSMQPEAFTNHPFKFISFYSISNLFRDRYAKTGFAC